MHELIRRLVAKQPVITDGAWGTELQAKGLEIGASPDVWNLTEPDKVEEVARAYVEAGSQVILTNTFGANRFVLSRQGLAEKVAEINRAGVEISRRAAGDRAKVFASIGPSGKMLAIGEVTAAQLAEAFAEQAEAIAAAGADAIVIETMSDRAEVRAAVAAARQTGLPVVASMTFESGRDNDRTLMGVTPEEAVETLLEAGVDCVGANCGQGIAAYVAICRRLRQALEKGISPICRDQPEVGAGPEGASHKLDLSPFPLPVWIKANAGLPEIIDGRTVYRQTPAEFAASAPALVAAGASFIGGCCGTTPDFIRAIRERLGR